MRFSQMTLSELCDFAKERGVRVELKYHANPIANLNGERKDVGPFWALEFAGSRGRYAWAVRADSKDLDLDRCHLEEIIAKVGQNADAA